MFEVSLFLPWIPAFAGYEKFEVAVAQSYCGAGLGLKSNMRRKMPGAKTDKGLS